MVKNNNVNNNYWEVFTVNFLNTMKERAKSDKKTIVLPESYEIRTLVAADIILREETANIILVGDKAKICEIGKDCNLENAIFIDPEKYEKMDEFVDVFVELRKSKGMTPEQALKSLKDPLHFGVMLVKQKLADGMVSGAVNATANVLRPALQILKTDPSSDIVSSFFIMVCPDKSYGEDGVFLFADCGLNQSPNDTELASIAGSSAKTFKALVGAEPRIAMLSHSTMGSAKHADVDKMVSATKIAKEKYPDLKIDGELQLDAAIVPSVGQQKAPGSEVAGRANVLIFPDLDAGNIGYKLVQRLAGAEAYGPALQGIAKPVNDLSRGCSAEDIVGVVAITAVQAQLQ